MSTITLTNYDSAEVEDLQHSEKMKRQSRGIMPAHRCQSAIRGSHRAPVSRRKGGKKPTRKGGMQCRRNNRPSW